MLMLCIIFLLFKNLFLVPLKFNRTIWSSEFSWTSLFLTLHHTSVLPAGPTWTQICHLFLAKQFSFPRRIFILSPCASASSSFSKLVLIHISSISSPLKMYLCVQLGFVSLCLNSSFISLFLLSVLSFNWTHLHTSLSSITPFLHCFSFHFTLFTHLAKSNNILKFFRTFSLLNKGAVSVFITGPTRTKLQFYVRRWVLWILSCKILFEQSSVSMRVKG